MITCVSRCKSVPDWIKSSTLWACKSQDPRLLLQPCSCFSSLNRISSKLINRGGWSSYHPLSNHNNVNSTSESALHFPRELKHMLMYACFVPCAHTQQDNCWSLSFVVYLQSGSGFCDKSPPLTEICGFHASSWTSPWEKEELNETFECLEYFSRKPHWRQQAWKK